MKRFRIEVYVLGVLKEYWETDSHREARRIYWQNNNRLDRWTQLYVDGKTGPKVWMDRELGGGQEYGYLTEITGQEAESMKRRKKK